MAETRFDVGGITKLAYGLKKGAQHVDAPLIR